MYVAHNSQFAFHILCYNALPLSNVHHFLLIKPFSCSIPVVYCGDPGTPTNGRRTLWSTSYNSVVAYTCDVGYELQGSNTRTCQADGQWSGSLPPCSRKFSVHCFYSSSQQSAPKQLMNNCSWCAVQYDAMHFIALFLLVHVSRLNVGFWFYHYLYSCVCYNTAVCSPPCENGGTCSAPDTCTCDIGFTGTECGTGGFRPQSHYIRNDSDVDVTVTFH